MSIENEMEIMSEKSIEPSWDPFLKEEFQKPYMQSLKQFLIEEKKAGKKVYPPSENVFEAFKLTPYDKVKVVIIGQDPYHGPNQAHGLCFSVQPHIPLPPSLKNIYKEIQEDVGLSPASTGYLVNWAKQGVFLLNATLTVREGQPASHQKRGWEEFTDRVIERISLKKEPLVFILWGRSAQDKVEKVLHSNPPEHLILKAAHPSPFSAYNGFFGCKHFSKTNEHLRKYGLQPIDWSVN